MIFTDDAPAFPIGDFGGLTKGEYEAIHRKNSRGFQVYLAALTGLYAAGYRGHGEKLVHDWAVKAARVYEADTGSPQ